MTGPETEIIVASEQPVRRYTGFVPLVLIALSLISVLSWELFNGIQARQNFYRLREQQARLVEQSKKIQGSLEKLARDLINVANTDTDARSIVTKYGINITNPAASPAPASSP